MEADWGEKDGRTSICDHKLGDNGLQACKISVSIIR